MQTATTVNGSRIDFSWEPSDPSVNISSSYFFVFYFSELQNLQSKDVRQFDIVVNNKRWNTQPYTPPFLFADSFWGIVQGLANYSVSLVATKNATLPPILNAMEMYLVKPITEVGTDPRDGMNLPMHVSTAYVSYNITFIMLNIHIICIMRGIKLNELQLLFTTFKVYYVHSCLLACLSVVVYGHEHFSCPGELASAMMAMQEKFGVNKNWMGDPCAPKSFAWEGLNCSYSPVYPSRITALNLSSFGLAGAICTDFGDLNALQYLDLSHNNLSGTIPDFLGQLPLLIFLDLSSNDLHGAIPYSLLQKAQNGTLSLRVGNNANLCANGIACGSGRKKISGELLAAIVVPVTAVIISLFVVLFLLLHQKLKGKATRKATGPEDESALLENREFSYRELKHITSNFSQEIGKGGFGAVYFGYLENGNPVAVKVHSDSSSQGGKEFLSEAQHLTRIHHKNLVSLIGYCKDKNHLALVYEYMPEGNLQDHLRGSTSKPLTWEQRLHIACDAAQGLEYLHTACKPALIHRDVKSANILLTADLGAKVADFGLTKVFGDSKTHITTQPAGTIGYLDPEYFRIHHISEKSDVYSFGVVLLELITGRPPVVPISDSVSIHVGEWVNRSLDHGTIESIVDAKMGGDYDINSIWKVADLALHCKREVSRERPTMSEVVTQLKECLELEKRGDGRRSLGSLEVELQGREIQAVASGPTMR